MENVLFLRGMVALEENTAFLGSSFQRSNTDKTGLLDQPLVPAMSDEEAAACPAGLDEMVDTAVALEQMRQALARTPADQPISKSSASVIKLAVEHMCARVGISQESFVSLEQFDLGRPARIEATHLALEGLGNAIKNLVVKILAWVKRASRLAYDSVLDSYQGAQKYVKKAKEIEELALSVKTAHGNQRIPGAIKNSNIGKMFGRHQDPRAIFNDYERYNSEFNETFSGHILASAINQLSSMGQDVLKHNASGVFGNDQAASAADRVIRWLQTNAFKRFETHGDVATYQLPFGELGFSINYTQQHDRYLGLTFQTVKLSDEKPAVTAKILTPEEVMSFAKAIDINGRRGLFKDFVKIKTQLQDVDRTLSHVCEAIARQQAQNTSGAVASLHFFQLIAHSLMDLTKGAYRYNAIVHGALIKYCTASMKMYEKLPEISHQKARASGKDLVNGE